jgi:hypothetical protein
MTFNLHTILESKRALRRALAARPVAEKLRLLDALRERQLAIRGRAVRSRNLREEPAPCLSTIFSDVPSAKADYPKPL